MSAPKQAVNSKKASETLKGDIFCVLNGVCFLVGAAVTRRAVVASPDEFLFARIIAFFILGLIDGIRSGDLLYLLRDSKLMYFAALNGFATVNMNLTYLLTLNHLATSDAYVINRLRVVVTGIMSSLLIDQPFGLFSLLCTFLILIGASLIAKPSFFFATEAASYNIPGIGYFIICAAVFFGGANSVFLQIAHRNSCFITSSQFIFMFGVTGLVQYIISGYFPSSLEFVKLDWDKILFHVIVSVGTIVFFKLSLDNISAQRFAVVSCILIPISFIVDAIFVSSQLQFTSFAGAVFVFFGVLLYTRAQKKIEEK